MLFQTSAAIEIRRLKQNIDTVIVFGKCGERKRNSKYKRTIPAIPIQIMARNLLRKTALFEQMACHAKIVFGLMFALFVIGLTPEFRGRYCGHGQVREWPRNWPWPQ